MEPRSKIPGKVFGIILVPRERGGDLIKSPPFFSLLKEIYLNLPQKTKNQKPRFPKHFFWNPGSWLHGGDLTKYPPFLFLY